MDFSTAKADPLQSGFPVEAVIPKQSVDIPYAA